MPIYAMVITLEADNQAEAEARITGEVGPEPANAHFISDAIEIDPPYSHSTKDVTQRILAADLLSGVQEHDAEDPAYEGDPGYGDRLD